MKPALVAGRHYLGDESALCDHVQSSVFDLDIDRNPHGKFNKEVLRSDIAPGFQLGKINCATLLLIKL